ncbi:MAG TPA: polysaccharide biosynthesis/export family protein [Candidatus Dormibacteraeota bacterium]|nr:polysaccharide biosynthesis/export family protein [Candidatus Dormibacteraeota bacterium]
MNETFRHRFKNVARLAVAIAAIFLGASGAQATLDDSGKPPAAISVEDYKIGPSDVLTIAVPDAPEFGGKFRVSDSGVIEVPGVTTPIRAEGLTTIELAHIVRDSLIGAKQLRDPRVSVFVEEYHGRTVTVLGAVAKPSVYPLTKRTNVLEAISLAGGSLPNSGNTVTIVRGAASAEATNTAPGSVKIVQMSDLTSGKDLAAGLEVKNGDVVNVSSAQLIYVVGAVTKPGGYTMSDPSSGVSVVQAVALAEGLKGVASTHALIVRQSTNDKARIEIPVDLRQMMAGKSTDMLLAPNDILYVPTSGARQTLKVMGEVALSAVNGVAIYGLGYRVGGIR